ncbi:MAG: Pr2TM family membrane protein [Acidimicrobiia bacterium]|nr:Pr2TM family membrane protein [Acidimicrobiia bacterium]
MNVSRQYSTEEVGDIIDVASRLESLTKERKRQMRTGVTYEQLVEIASEFGISEEAVLRALDTSNAVAPATAAPSKAPRWSRLLRFHAATYATTMAGLTIIDIAEGEGLDWVWFPAAGWGIWLSFHALLNHYYRNR